MEMTRPPSQSLCPNCLRSTRATYHFCTACGAPLTPHAATDPLKLMWAFGHGIVKSVRRPTSRIAITGWWAILAPVFVCFAFYLCKFLQILFYISLPAQEITLRPWNPVTESYDTHVVPMKYTSTAPVDVILLGAIVSVVIVALLSLILLRVTRNYRRQRALRRGQLTNVSASRAPKFGKLWLPGTNG